MYKLLFIAIFALFALSASSALAQEDITENLKKRLQDSLLAPTSPTPDHLLALRSYVGTVKDVISTTLVIDDKDGKKDVKIADVATIVRSPGNAVIKAANINIGDSIIAIGTPETDEILLGKRLIVSSSPFTASTKISSVGTVRTVAKKTLTLTINNSAQVLALTSKTIFKSPAGPIELADLTAGDTVIYTATLDDDDQTATIVMRIKTAPIAE